MIHLCGTSLALIVTFHTYEHEEEEEEEEEEEVEQVEQALCQGVTVWGNPGRAVPGGHPSTRWHRSGRPNLLVKTWCSFDEF